MTDTADPDISNPDIPSPNIPNPDDNIRIVQQSFQAYQQQDRAAAEHLMAEEFVFTSPQDDHIDRAQWLERCFPTSSRMKTQRILRITAASDDDVFVMYEYELQAGGTFRNAELITVRDGQLVETQVFFGGAVEPPPAKP